MGINNISIATHDIKKMHKPRMIRPKKWLKGH